MFASLIKSLLRSRRRRLARRNQVRPRPLRCFESLEKREVFAVTGMFSPAIGILTVIGDAQDNSITLSRNAAGAILINGGAVQIKGGTPTVANTALIQAFGLGGNDTIALDESQGALPRANLFGGTGNDTLIGGSGNDMIFGQEANDILLGRGGVDFLFGGANNDVLTGRDGDDQVFGESGNDRMIWNPGDDTDLNEGGAGIDTVEVNGGNGAESFTVTANGARVRFDRVNPAPFALDIGTSENLVVNANGGDDSFSATGNLAALIQITVDGGAGNDTILGGNGVDLLLGGDGNDFIDGNQGNDVIFLGAGDDVFQWDPGDGSDVVEGQDGVDAMIFNGSGVSEIIDIAANGERIRFFRNVGNVTMDLNDVENINFNALGGTDTIVVNNVAGTDLVDVNLDLSGTLGGSGGDGQGDQVILHGTNGNDSVEVLGTGDDYAVIGLAALVRVSQSEGVRDRLTVNLLAGDDMFSAATLPAGVTLLTVDGGAGNDVIVGSDGADVLLGGDGDDSIDGQRGDDFAFLGAGDDSFVWNPGDGSDVVEGQAGNDLLTFFGSDANENFAVSANGERVRFFRNVANVTMDLNDVERLDLRTLGGADNVNVGDLSGTDLVKADLDLRGTAGGGDGQADTVTVNGTVNADKIGVTGDAGGVAVFGLLTEVSIFHQEQAHDRLIINALGGADTIDASSLESDGIQLTLNGGLGDDLLIGSDGDDLAIGGDGNDLALLGAGDDTFVWNPGDDNDVVEGQAGFDRLVFNGSNVSEIIDIAANGERVRFFRNVGNVTMDLNDVESIDFNALGGADTIVANDLSGTDVVDVNLILAATNGGGDAQPDSVIVNGTSGDDVILVVGDASGIAVLGLSATINVTGAEAATDRLQVNLLAGDDVVEASGLAAGAIQFVSNGGDGDDVMIGSDGADVMQGGAGDDVLIGGPGLDILDGGPGDNIVIQ